MDTSFIQININTPIEVEYHFLIADIFGNKHQAMIRYQYPLYVKDYFSRVESILVNDVLKDYKPRLTKDTLYCARKREFLQKSLNGLRFVGDILVTFNPDISVMSEDKIASLLTANGLKCYPIRLPLYVRYDGPKDNLIINHENYNYSLTKEWEDIAQELSYLNKIIHNQLPNCEMDKFWLDVFNSYYTIDSIIVPADYYVKPEALKNLVLEYKTYKNVPGTTKTYRIDPANTNTRTQKHIHVFFDGKQIYAMNIDGTPHDGSKYRLSKADLRFLKDLGFKTPDNGILEMYTFKGKENAYPETNTTV